MSALSQIAKDPSCILAVDALQGGRWLSCIRPPVPRNFAESPMTFTDSYTAQDGIGTDDFTLEVSFSFSENTYTGSFLRIGCLVAAMRGTNMVEVLVASADTTGAVTMLHPVGVSGIIVPIRRIVVAGRDAKVFATVYGKGGVVIKEGSVDIPSGYRIVPNVSATNMDGTISAASIRNDTTGETIWQAAYSDLYDTSKPWPSDVPRNFAEEEKSFYDYQAILSEQLDPTHDYSFFMDTEIVSDKSEFPMFYIGGADGVFGLYCYSNNTIRFTTNLLRSATNPNDKYASMLVYRGDARPAGRHSFEGRIEGNIIKTFFDNQPAFTSAVAVRTNTKTVGCNRCNSGYVYKIQIEDLTTGRTVWRYPTWEERTRLLTKNNVRTDRGVFEAADTSKRWSVTTKLRAAALLPECTIIVEADNPNGELVTFVSCAQRPNPTQGFFVIRKPDVGSLLFGYSGKNSSGANSYPTRFITCQGGKHVFAFVLDYSALQLRIYIDGAEVDNRAMSTEVVAPPDFDETANPVIIGSVSGSDSINGSTKISHCLIFDRALTASEIAAVSHAVV